MNLMTSAEIRQKFLNFFEKNGHKIVPSSSLIPDDPSVLLTTAGMQQFKSYYTGDADSMKDFGSKNVASVQKCFRTSDIDEVGDESHLTFFEMLGNFSFGGYFKEKAIEYGYKFIKEEMGLEIEYVTIFDPEKVPAGDWRKGVPFDGESEKIWKNYGVNIKREGTDVFWGPTGNEGPCGPTTEIYVKNAGGKAIEIWNIVFNEFYRDKENKLTPLQTPGVDTGMGLERLTMVVQSKPTIFETDLFESVIKLFGNMSDWHKRIIADHIRGIVFLIAEGILPNNKDQGYILRRLMRRVMPHLKRFQGIVIIPEEGAKKWSGLDDIARVVIDQYSKVKSYHYLLDKKEEILRVIEEEVQGFNRVFEESEKILNKIKFTTKNNIISGKDIFDLVTSHGTSLEWIKDFAKMHTLDLDLGGFDKEFAKHQEISRAGAEKKFGGHGLVLDTGELKAGNEEELKKVTRFHTATHLLHQALREVLGTDVAQRGSDITTERTRFDFTFNRKMTPEEIKKTEEIVNEKIKEDLQVQFKEMSKAEAENTGALHFFKAKYPDTVKVYYVGESLDNAWSREFCGGPHVARTGEIGKLRITKEEASSAGVRRIRAVIE